MREITQEKTLILFGLWQATFTRWSSQSNHGINNGQPNIGIFIGIGYGISGSYNPNDSPCEDPHREYGAIIEGKIGRGEGVDVSAYDSTVDKELSVEAGAPISGSIGVKNGKFEEPNVSLSVGESVFFGGGVKVYQPIDSP